MNNAIIQAFILGAERVSAWADLLDSINVFPIADGDTGRNMKISLSPLRELGPDRERTVHTLLVNARGNSGNIAARFFSGFLSVDSLEAIPAAAKLGRDRAWKAVQDPKPGTMLTIFDALVEALDEVRPSEDGKFSTGIIARLEQAVRSTPDLLPALKEAGVVDSGALGMFIYFEGFFKSLTRETGDFRPITSVFGDKLSIAPSFTKKNEEGYCIDITLDAGGHKDEALEKLAEMGESVVVIPGDDYVKLHLHTGDTEDVRRRMESIGSIVRWSDDDLGEQVREFRVGKLRQAIHIMTDAAGSVTSNDARRLGITLLDSYITIEDHAAPETSMKPDDIYPAMRRGARVSTSQASEFERHELYKSATSRHERVLYVCVGSVFTGNYDVAVRWKMHHDPENRMTVIDTGAASGRLGVIAIAAAKYSNSCGSADSVIDFTRRAVERCEEYIFIDTLKFLAAGGRISKTKAFFGNMFGVKPVVTPTSDGVVPAGTAKNLNDQVSFALKKLADACPPDSRSFIMLQYTDNRAMVEDMVMPEITKRHPKAEIKLQPLSLTTGVHVGPGTWSLAFLPDIESTPPNPPKGG
jgi:DegV family protein with EDD domain